MAAPDFSKFGTLDEAPDFSDQSVEALERRPSAMDVAKIALQGLVGDTAKGVGWGVEKLGLDAGTSMRHFGDDMERDLLASMTPGGRRAAQTPVFEGEGITDLRPTDKWGQSLVMGAARSLPQMLSMIIPGTAVAKGVQAIPAVAKLAGAPGALGVVGRNLPGALGFGATEGVQSGAMNAADTVSKIEAMDPEKLAATSPRFRELLGKMDPAAAKRVLADEASSQVFNRTLPWTGGIGALTGGGALGELVKPGMRSVLKGITHGAGEEALQETLQSGGEQYIQNTADRNFVDDSTDPWKQVVSQALTGGAVGGATGGAVGGAGRATRLFDGKTGEQISPLDTARGALRDTGQAQERAVDMARRVAESLKARAAGVAATTGEKDGNVQNRNPEAAAVGPSAPELEPDTGSAAAAPAAASADLGAGAPAGEAAVQAAGKAQELLDTGRVIDDAAHEAASSPNNDRPEPSSAQIKANNAKLGHVDVAGMDVSIENPAGSVREDKANATPQWRVEMKDHYGYIRRTKGFDKDHLDAFVKPGTKSTFAGPVYIVNQSKDDGSFDEHKALVGYASQDEARDAYLANYDNQVKAAKRIRSIVSLPMQQFKNWAFRTLRGGPSSGELILPATHYLDDKHVIHAITPVHAAPKGSTTFTDFEAARAARITRLKSEAQQKKKLDVDRDSIVDAVIKLGGLSMDERADTLGDDKAQRAINGVGYLFTKKGTGADDMATRLGQYGYLSQEELADVDGGVGALKEKLREEFGGQRRHYSMESDAALRGEADRRRQLEEEQAAAQAGEAGPPPDDWSTLTDEEKDARLDKIYGKDPAPARAPESEGNDAPALGQGEREPGQDDEGDAGSEPAADEREASDLDRRIKFSRGGEHKYTPIDPAGAIPDPTNERPLHAAPEDTLILMACSQTKLDTATAVPLFELYTGPLWQTLRAHLGKVSKERVVALSGKWGWAGSSTMSAPYNERLSREKADDLIRLGMDGNPHMKTPPKTGGPRMPSGSFASQVYSAAAGDKDIGSPQRAATEATNWKNVVMVGGQDYMRVFHAMVAQMVEAGMVDEDASIKQAEGGIGEMRQQLGAMLEQISGKEKTEARPAEAGHAEEQVALEKHGLPADTQFEQAPAERKLIVGQWRAFGGGESSNWHKTHDAAAAELKRFLDSSADFKVRNERVARMQKTIAEKLRAGESPTFNEWRIAFPTLREGHTYLQQPLISPFLIEHFGFKRNDIRAQLGKAAGTVTSDSGAQYPIVYFNRLADVLKTGGLDLTRQTEADLKAKEQRENTGQTEEKAAAVRDRDTAILSAPAGTAPPAELKPQPTQQPRLLTDEQNTEFDRQAAERRAALERRRFKVLRKQHGKPDVEITRDLTLADARKREKAEQEKLEKEPGYRGGVMSAPGIFIEGYDPKDPSQGVLFSRGGELPEEQAPDELRWDKAWGKPSLGYLGDQHVITVTRIEDGHFEAELHVGKWPGGQTVRQFSGFDGADKAIRAELAQRARMKKRVLAPQEIPEKKGAKTWQDVEWHEMQDYYVATVNALRGLIWKKPEDLGKEGDSIPPFRAIVGGTAEQLENKGEAQTFDEAKRIAWEGSKLPIPGVEETRGSKPRTVEQWGRWTADEQAGPLEWEQFQGEARAFLDGNEVATIERVDGRYELEISGFLWAPDDAKVKVVDAISKGRKLAERIFGADPKASRGGIVSRQAALERVIEALDTIIPRYEAMKADYQVSLLKMLRKDYEYLLAHGDAVFYQPPTPLERPLLAAVKRNERLHSAGEFLESPFDDDPKEHWPEKWFNRLRATHGERWKEKARKALDEMDQRRLERPAPREHAPDDQAFWDQLQSRNLADRMRIALDKYDDPKGPKESRGGREDLADLAASIEALEAVVDRAYERGSPAAEDLDALLADLKEELASAVEQNEAEQELDPAERGEPDEFDYSTFDEELRQAYVEMRTGLAEQDAIERIRGAIVERRGKTVQKRAPEERGIDQHGKPRVTRPRMVLDAAATDQQIRDAMADAYAASVARRVRRIEVQGRTAFINTADGPVLVTPELALVMPSHVKYNLGDDLTYYEHTIAANREGIGSMVAGWKDGKVEKLLDLFIFENEDGTVSQRKKGYGEGALRALLEHNGATPIKVLTILNEARGFWSKIGTEIHGDEDGSDGTLSLSAYRAARPDQSAAPAKPRKSRAQDDRPQEPRARRAGPRQAQGVDRQQFEQKLTEAFGPGVKGLLESGLFKFAADGTHLPPKLRSLFRHGTEAFHDSDARGGKGEIWFVGSELAANRVVPVTLHELGEHHGLEAMLGPDAYSDMLDSVRRSKDTNPVIGAAWAHVRRRYPELPEGGRDFVLEVVAKVGESPKALQLPFYRRILAAMREFLIRLGLKAGLVRQLSDQDLILLVTASARRAIAREGVRGHNTPYEVPEDRGADRDRRPAAERDLHPAGAVPRSRRSQEKAPIFFSALREQVAALKQASASAEQWKATIRALPGIKKHEIEWSGIEDYIDGVKASLDASFGPGEKKPPIFRQTLLDYLSESGVRVEETMLGDTPAPTGEMATLLRERDDIIVNLDAMGYDPEWAQDGSLLGVVKRSEDTLYMADPDDPGTPTGAGEGLDRKPYRSLSRNSGVRLKVDRLREIALKTAQHGNTDNVELGTRYDAWKLPGGENYRELLLTLPAVPYETAGPKGWGDTAGGTAMRAGFQSSHFDQKNVVAHIRFDERADAEGKRVLFVEEIQSDWAERGRKDGFRGQTQEHAKAFFGISDADWTKASPEDREAYRSEMLGHKGGIPAAPFVGKTEAWVALALKRAIRYAAENGFERVAWTSGEQQVERYGLQRQVDRISGWKNEDGTYSFHADRKNYARSDNPVLQRNISEKTLFDFVGDELGRKLLDKIDAEKATSAKKAATLEGLELKIGGKGMKTFYDKIVPNVANDVLKKLGGGRVGEVDVTRPGPPTDRTNKGAFAGKQPGFDITPALRSSALEGMPLFSRGGNPQPDIFVDPDTRDGPAIEIFTLRGRHNLAERAKSWLAAAFDRERTFNFWNKTVGTQYHKAMVSAPYKRVFVEGQSYLTDTNLFSMQAEELAPELLLRVEGLKDLAKRPPSQESQKKLGTALFEGTLWGGADPTKGKIFNDRELRESYGMSEKEIGLYRQVRASIDHSLETMAKSIVARLVRTYDIKIDRDMVLPDVVALAQEKLAEARQETMLAIEKVGEELVGEDDSTAAEADMISMVAGEPSTAHKRLPRRIKLHQKLEAIDVAIQKIAEIEKRVRAMQGAGYMPLMRFGRYTVNVTEMQDEKPAEVFFGRYESRAEAIRAEKALQQEFPHARVARGEMNEEEWKLYRGLSPDVIEVFADIAGLSEHPLMQQYIQLAVSDRSALKRMLERKGIPGFSWDIPRVLSAYITSNARAASGNFHHARMLEAIQDIPQKQGDVGREATRLYEYLTTPVEEAQALRGYLFFHFMGGSVATALVNMTQPVMMTGPWLAQHTSVAKATKELSRAMVEAARSEPPADAAGQALKRARGEGTVAPHEIYQLMAEARGGIGRSIALRQITRMWGGLFSLTEAWNRSSTFLAAYRVGEAKGVEDPYHFAVQAVNETQGIYNRGNRPNWARGPVGSTVFTFKQFSIAYLEFVKRLPARQKALALGVLWLAVGLQGMPGADDLDDIVDTIGQWMGYATNSKRFKRRMLADLVGEGAAEYVLHGISALPGMPLDIQARLGLGNLIPGTSIFKPSDGSDKGREISEVLGPAGGLAKGGVAVAAALFRGDAGAAAKAGLPTSLKNAYQGVEMFQTGEYRDAHGRRVIDTDAQDSFVKAIGFNPAKIAKESRKIGEALTSVNLQRETESSIAEQWARAIVDKDDKGRAAARQRMRDWNEKNPELRIAIDNQQLRRRVIELRRTREERFIKRAAPEIRANVARDLRE